MTRARVATAGFMNDQDDENNRNDTTDQAREVKNVPIFNGVAVERWRSCWRRWVVGVGVVEVEVEVVVVVVEVVVVVVVLLAFLVDVELTYFFNNASARNFRSRTSLRSRRAEA